MIHPDTELRYINNVIGYGVFATKLIPKGTITWVLDHFDQTFTQEEIDQLDPHYRSIIDWYAYIEHDGQHVLCWDHTRFVNHSCKANCFAAGFNFEIAVQDIFPNEELTNDYGILNRQYDFPCACGAENCRKILKRNDIKKLYPIWDKKVQEAFSFIPSLPQPLWNLVKEKEEMATVLKKPPSTLKYFYSTEKI
ncbi:MAG: hypothetical protein A3F67_07285 [Verrucomicrobia bacterium RIFCSPHIGHO2_12_FULL_41_10]|nr:MAG: hypothetical protein A3F67_07285 [Verrucomicrobia bacterium RIFCSPHIGHO2_12_FULL_41_10]HLB33455.1 SET domain-containing protein [Chthoniobacterales bacterium]